MDQQELISVAFKMTMALGVVLLFFSGAIFLLKKFSNNPISIFSKNQKTKSVKPLEILAYQGLGPGRGIYLLRCLDKKVLIGSTNASIQHLADITEEEELPDDLKSEGGIRNFQNSFSKNEKINSKASSFEKELKEIARV